MSDDLQPAQPAHRDRPDDRAERAELLAAPPTPPRAADEFSRVDLPPSLAELVEETVRRTRLRRRERADIARELNSHLAEGIAAGVDASVLARKFGEPKRVAPLLRTAARRRRHPVDRGIVGLLKWGSLSVAAIVTLYLAVALRMSFLEPRIGFDPVDRANRALPVANPSQQAWPIYRDALTWLRDLERSAGSPDVFSVMDPDVTEADRERAIAHIRARRTEIAELRRAAAQPTFGWHASRHLSPADAEWFGLEDVNETPVETAFEIRLPYLTPMRSAARLLATDARVALEEGDGSRAVDNWIAMLGVARHSAEFGTLINQLVESAVVDLAALEVVAALQSHPQAIEDQDLVRLQHAFATIDPRTWLVDLRLERLMFEDVLQRTYSDDGSGDGVLLPAPAMRLLGGNFEFTPFNQAGPTRAQRSVAFIAAPLGAAVVAGRRETMALVDRLYGLVAEEVTLPILHRNHQLDREVEMMMGDLRMRMRHPFVTILMPAIGRASDVRTSVRTIAEGAMVAVALERWRRLHGETAGADEWPRSLDQLVPEFIPAVPLDAYDGQPVRYRLDANGPVLWSIGADGVDQGGVIGRDDFDRPQRRPHRWIRGDIVLFDGRSAAE